MTSGGGGEGIGSATSDETKASGLPETLGSEAALFVGLGSFPGVPGTKPINRASDGSPGTPDSPLVPIALVVLVEVDGAFAPTRGVVLFAAPVPSSRRIVSVRALDALELERSASCRLPAPSSVPKRPEPEKRDRLAFVRP